MHLIDTAVTSLEKKKLNVKEALMPGPPLLTVSELRRLYYNKVNEMLVLARYMLAVSSQGTDGLYLIDTAATNLFRLLFEGGKRPRCDDRPF